MDSSKAGVLEGVKGQSEEGQRNCSCGEVVKASNPWEKQISNELWVRRKDGKAEVP